MRSGPPRGAGRYAAPRPLAAAAGRYRRADVSVADPCTRGGLGGGEVENCDARRGPPRERPIWKNGAPWCSQLFLYKRPSAWCGKRLGPGKAWLLSQRPQRPESFLPLPDPPRSAVIVPPGPSGGGSRTALEYGPRRPHPSARPPPVCPAADPGAGPPRCRPRTAVRCIGTQFKVPGGGCMWSAASAPVRQPPDLLPGSSAAAFRVRSVR